MQLEQALYFSMITTYAQGMALLQRASKEYGYDLNLSKVAEIWRGGCIIRAALLEQISAAYAQQPDLGNLMLSDAVIPELAGSQQGVRDIANIAAQTGVPVPAAPQLFGGLGRPLTQVIATIETGFWLPFTSLAWIKQVVLVCLDKTEVHKLG